MSTTDPKALTEQFYRILEQDRKYQQNWLITWQYQEKRKKRNVSYTDGPKDFSTFTSITELVDWFKWFHSDYPDYLGSSLVDPLIEKSEKTDREALSVLGLNLDFSFYRKNIGINNAHDFLLPQLYPVPGRYKIGRVLDFGAGFGRQANLWTEDPSNLYVGIDAVPKPYCLQHVYYGSLNRPFRDYISDPGNFSFGKDSKGIMHIPTWRYDLLPDNYFDLVSCVQVLPELNSKLIKKMLEEFLRVLKPGGMLYIRDHAATWKPAGKVNVDAYLKKLGYVLEFTPHIINDKDLHGIPRIYRKPDPAVIASVTRTMKQRMAELVNDADYYSGGLLKKVARKVIKKS